MLHLIYAHSHDALFTTQLEYMFKCMLTIKCELKTHKLYNIYCSLLFAPAGGDWVSSAELNTFFLTVGPNYYCIKQVEVLISGMFYFFIRLTQFYYLVSIKYKWSQKIIIA